MLGIKERDIHSVLDGCFFSLSKTLLKQLIRSPHKTANCLNKDINGNHILTLGTGYHLWLVFFCWVMSNRRSVLDVGRIEGGVSDWLAASTREAATFICLNWASGRSYSRCCLLWEVFQSITATSKCLSLKLRRKVTFLITTCLTEFFPRRIM